MILCHLENSKFEYSAIPRRYVIGPFKKRKWKNVMNLCKRKYLLSSMMSAYSVVKAGRNEVTSRSLGCLGPPLPDPVEPRIGLPPETYEAVRQLRISDKKF